MPITKEQAQRLVEVAQALVEGKLVTFGVPSDTHIAGNDRALYFDAKYTIHELPPAPRWRPFKDDQEFKPFRSKWLKLLEPADDEERSERFRCEKYDKDGLWVEFGEFVSYPEAFDRFGFDDETGSPFGVKA